MSVTGSGSSADTRIRQAKTRESRARLVFDAGNVRKLAQLMMIKSPVMAWGRDVLSRSHRKT